MKKIKLQTSNKGIWILSFIICIVFSSFAFAGTSVDPSQTIYMGKTLGMGGAHVALSNDGEGLFSNPSGLSNIKYPKITGVARNIFLDETTYSILSFIVPTNYGSLGVGYAKAMTGGSYATTRDNNNRISIEPSLEVMSYNNNVILLSYANSFSQLQNSMFSNLSLGGNLKLFNQSISGGGIDSSGSGTSLDVGATYKMSSWLTVGGNLQNVLGGVINWNSSSTDKIGGFYKLGIAANLLGPSNEAYKEYHQKLIAVFDYDLPHDTLQGSSLMHLGFEWSPLNFLAIRGGLNQESGGTGLTLGVGIEKEGFRFDYAYAARPGIIGDNPHYFSLSYIGTEIINTNKKLKKKESALKILTPSNRLITTFEAVLVSATAKYTATYEQKTTWTTPLISSSSETKEIQESYDLADIYINNKKIGQTGDIKDFTEPLAYGRHVIKVIGMITPEATPVTSEVVILRFKPFSDTTMTHWAIEAIALDSELDLIKGFPDNTFKPDAGITRAELISILVRTLEIPPQGSEEANNDRTFTDVSEKHWAKNYINQGVKLGLAEGYPDNTFKPNKILNRAEGISIITRYANLPEKNAIVFSDLKEDFWANKFIASAKDGGLINYIKEEAFKPDEDFSRAEASEVLYRTKQVQKMVDDFWKQGATQEKGKVPDWMLEDKEAVTDKTNQEPVTREGEAPAKNVESTQD
ncbi:hypothetical protein A2230_03525 [candidate division WOR-1 bacterium RIFOXYA2_FULL_36_21]|uniref:SLH domain-containing protein n=1 Tax=candidate division WOR-1 bacterium RIFOXYB2_FULL_36_35 TaxID=1802578 RepID=A0A1F4S163_UNCSA|nr:MAG: hypothetical protein A2230_03525 [candidate division WOR-1 bacterium RIFOXYA2_FULL_36_21]OGC14168.1 MAG: hypothetical protein A2290_00635 [candidate division WOR-1 bacterium RIFOXYB2_FULL_36_35]OGC15390.1 MAG: hypothetical protein A2282_01625 [candidate division WOR-1 bacterium RIFOXYA12_FULL_36_13]